MSRSSHSYGVVCCLIAIASCHPPSIAAHPPQISSEVFRRDVESQLVQAAADFEKNPTDDSRRALARICFQLGEFGRTSELIEPLASRGDAPRGDLLLAARVQYLLGKHAAAEALFRQILANSPADSDESHKAAEGLLLAIYQQNQFAKAADLELPHGSDDDQDSAEHKLGPLLTFMQKFGAEPYSIQWKTDARIAHVPFTNDIEKLGALPEMDVQVNGKTVHLLLDTGGDRLYLDAGVAQELGIRTVAERKAKYAYTGGKEVTEPLGIADSMQMGDVVLSNVPVIVAQWKSMGQKTDGVLTTHILKQFLSTIDYDQRRITLRPREPKSIEAVRQSWNGKPPVTMPFAMSGSHLMFAKGGINDRSGLNLFVDSGLAASMPMIVANETVQDLSLDEQKNAVQGSPYFWIPIEKLSMGPLEIGPTQALGNVFVEKDNYRSQGFFFDALISHQFLRQFGSWTIDFDNMQYYFPPR